MTKTIIAPFPELAFVKEKPEQEFYPHCEHCDAEIDFEELYCPDCEEFTSESAFCAQRIKWEAEHGDN